MSLESKVKKKLIDSNISYKIIDNIVFLNGSVKKYDDWIDIGLKIGEIKGVEGVINEITWNYNKIDERKNKRKKTYDQQKNNLISSYDIAIIGGGVIGCFIARELSKYTDSIILFEQDSDVSLGASRANNGMIHPGISPKRKTLKRLLNIKGNASYENVCKELDVEYKRVGSLILITPSTFEKYRKKLPSFLYFFLLSRIIPFFAKRKGKRNGVKGIKILRGKKIFKIEPRATRDTIAAIYIPSTGILDPYDLTIALMENAVDNNVEFKLNTEVVGFVKKNNRIDGVVTNKGLYNCKLVINAAGVFTDEIAELAGSREYTIHPRKGVELMFDNSVIPSVNHCLAELILPTLKTSKGGGVNPTIHGNVIWGPTAVEVIDKNDTSVGTEELSLILEKYTTVLQDFPKDKLIRYFAGVRAPTFTEDFIIRPAKWVDNLIHVAGIQSPGLASAPAIADYVVSLVKEKGFLSRKNPDFNPKRKGIKSAANMNMEELEKKIKKNPLWGRIICTCEMISEAEIIEAINRGAKSIDAIKRRTRAGMGNCQLSYCELRIASIISKQLNIPLNQVFKESAESNLYNGLVRGEEI